jgi:hypothetical protein
VTHLLASVIGGVLSSVILLVSVFVAAGIFRTVPLIAKKLPKTERR